MPAEASPGTGPAPSAPRSTHRILALDGLRGVAALMVLFHHTLLMLPDFANYEWGVPGAKAHGAIEWLLIRTPLRLLWAGQERALLFFVLSGFVLGLPWLERRAEPYGRFLLGRFRRIYPPYLIAMAAAAAASAAIGGHQLINATVYFNQLGWAFPPSWAELPGIGAILNNRSSAYINEAIWTLVWEVRVAILFPLMMLAIVRWRNVGVCVVLVALLALKHVASSVVGPWASNVLNMPEQTFYYAQYFVFGAAVAVNRVWITAWFAGKSPIFGLACLICWLPWPVQHDHIVGIGAALVLVAVLGGGPVRSWLSKSPIVWLGKQSYSLYLTHVPLIMIVVIACDGRVPLPVCVAVIPMAILLGWAFHRWVELPSVALAGFLTGYSSRTGKTPPYRTQTPSGPEPATGAAAR
jgi:peptidoglycan/LPS O-acetylase OafA/YrhL